MAKTIKIRNRSLEQIKILNAVHNPTTGVITINLKMKKDIPKEKLLFMLKLKDEG